MRSKRTTRAWLSGLVACCAVLMVMTPAGAVGEGEPTFLYGNGDIPADIAEAFGGCPSLSDFPDGFLYAYCANVTAYDGELKLGSVTASIDDPIEVQIGVGANVGTGEIVMVPGSGGGSGGGTSEVKISGGILGIPELDPIIDAEPLGLLRLSATPQIGALGATPDDATPTHLREISLPLSIKLNNILFGDNCQIGTPDEPFVINLTTGTTTPPAGVEPMVGAAPDPSAETQWRNFPGMAGSLGPPGYKAGTGALSVDNTFAVPGAQSCDLLPQEVRALGPQLGLGSLIGPKTGLFDPVINQVAGLPSPAGNNYMSIKVDTEWVTGNTVGAIRDEITPLHTATPAPVEFGEVAVGDTASEIVTVTNLNDTPLVMAPWSYVTFPGTDAADKSHFGIGANGCAGLTLQNGESCTVEVTFTPTVAGGKYAALTSGGAFGKVRSTAHGVGV